MTAFRPPGRQVHACYYVATTTEKLYNVCIMFEGEAVALARKTFFFSNIVFDYVELTMLSDNGH